LGAIGHGRQGLTCLRPGLLTTGRTSLELLVPLSELTGHRVGAGRKIGFDAHELGVEQAGQEGFVGPGAHDFEFRDGVAGLRGEPVHGL
jgi:hypothetical protein